MTLLSALGTYWKEYDICWYFHMQMFADKRVNHANQLLKEIKLLKLNAWEELFCQVIEKLRIKEVRQLFHKNLMFAVSGKC